MSLEETERASAAVATHPRVSLADIEAAIDAKFHFTADTPALIEGGSNWYAPDVEVPRVIDALKILTVCVLVMRNGFTVVGKSSCASPENFNPELQRRFSYEDAIRQLWPLMAFALRDRLSERAA